MSDNSPPGTSAARSSHQVTAADADAAARQSGLESDLARVALGGEVSRQRQDANRPPVTSEPSAAPGAQSEPIPFEGFSVSRHVSNDSGVSPGSSPGSASGVVGTQRGEGLWLGARTELSAGPGLGLGREGSARKGEVGRESKGGAGRSAGAHARGSLRTCFRWRTA